MSGSDSAWVYRPPVRFAAERRTLAWLCLAGLAAVAFAVLPLKWSAAFVGAAIVVVATALRPQVGVLLIVVTVPYGSLIRISAGVASLGLTEAAVFLVLGSWFLRAMAGYGNRLGTEPLTIPLIVFVGALCLSLPSALSLEHSAVELIKWLEVVAVFVLVSAEIHGRWARWVLAVFLATGAMTAMHGISQFLSGTGPESFLLFGRFVRAYGPFDQPNPFGGYLGLCLPLAMGLIGTAVLRKQDRLRAWWLVLGGGAGGLMLGAVIMSWSRGAWLGVVASTLAICVALLMRSARAWLWAGLAAVVLALAFLVTGPWSVDRFASERFGDLTPYLGIEDVRALEITDENYAVIERLAHWQAALGMWSSHVLLGVGLGNYEVAYPQFALPAWPEPLGHAHNYYLNIAAEAGLVGLTAFLALCGAALVQAWRAARHASGLMLGVALGALGAMVHLGVHSLFDNLFVHGIYLHLAILLGLLQNSGKGPSTVVSD